MKVTNIQLAKHIYSARYGLPLDFKDVLEDVDKTYPEDEHEWTEEELWEVVYGFLSSYVQEVDE